MHDESHAQIETPDWRARDEHVQALVAASLAAADPEAAVLRHLHLHGDVIEVEGTPYHLDPEDRVFLVGAGKAGVAMARGALQALGTRVTAGVMAVPDPSSGPSDPVEWIQGGHPLPSQESVRAGQRVEALLAGVRPQDVVLVLISGGGSALLELPIEGVSVEDLQAATQLLLQSGATIDEVNIVRRRLSKIKGGGLARLAAPARTVALLLSDVVGDRFEAIASGPTFDPRDGTSAALSVIQRHGLEGKLPHGALTCLESPAAVDAGETPGVQHVIIGNNRMAALAAADRARELGFRPLLLTSYLEGEAREVGRVLAALSRSVREDRDPLPAPACLILGGETTVHVVGPGRGGRNQELALAAALGIDGLEHCLVVSLATDGVDGPTPAAGGIVTGETIAQALAAGLDPHESLLENDSHSLLSHLGATLTTGPTGTNVTDLAFVLVYP